jgi:quercetin dioxygenase-like cupin family protein
MAGPTDDFASVENPTATLISDVNGNRAGRMEPLGRQAMAKVGDVFQVFINTVTIKVAGADNGGALAMFVEEVPAKTGVPMHVHRGATETLFVLRGRFKISISGKVGELSEGDGAFLPADVPHAYTNIGNERGQLLFTIYPSGLDGFFEEISRSGLDPATQLPDINHIAAKYQLEIVGPPLE